tara:strand:+ start:428 stop:1138 length:711 start_codon:yes stop_codon:yes gene_type:complete
VEDYLSQGIANTLTAPISYGIKLTIRDGLVILATSTIGGLFFRYIFMRYGNSFSSRSGFGNTILLVSISVASLIAVVKSSLALSLGLVGALSVVRFRTAVKEPYNLAFILLSVCFAIAVGASQYSFAFLIALFGSASIYLCYRGNTEINTLNSNNIILDTISITISDQKDVTDLYKILDRTCNSYTLKSLNTNENKFTNITLNLSIKSHETLNTLINQIKQELEAKDISFYSSPMT